MKIMYKFEIGKTYSASGLYGDTLNIEVIDRTKKTITFVYTDNKEEKYIKDIIIQGDTEGDIESVMAWEYYDNKCYWYSK